MSDSQADPLEALRASLPSGYELSGYLGHGGEGHVFRATLSGKNVALKVFRPNRDDRRLHRELDALGELDCPHLVRVLDSQTIHFDGVETTVVAYELLAGKDLHQLYVGSPSQVDETTLLTIGCHVSNAIETLWQRRIVHRDIKPANIMESGDGRFVLVDLGLARHLDLSDITLPGRVAGTEGYKSPEQDAGRRSLTINSDVFSLGVTLYELAAKRHPFNRAQHLASSMTPPPLSRVRSDLSSGATRIIEQMLAKVPARRPSGIYSRFVQLLEE